MVQDRENRRFGAFFADMADAPAERAERGSALGVLDAHDPADDGATRKHERGPDRHDADLGTLARHALAEQEDHDERDRRDQRDEPRLVEEEHPARP